MKLVLLGPIDSAMEEILSRARSLQIEHVSPGALARRGISRTAGKPGGNDDLSAMRRWFFARKPDAGFVLTGFPATLLQARVFDEWLDARGEDIDAAVGPSGGFGAVWEHYRTLGLLLEEPRTAR